MSGRLSRNRDDSGAIAIVVAVLALAIFGIAALSVDLGTAWAVRRNVQGDTDFAALAGGAGSNLPATAAGGSCTTSGASWTRPLATDPAVVDAAQYLSEHRSRSLSFSATNSTAAVSAAQLVNCDFSDGEAAYGKWSGFGSTVSFTADKNQLSLISPSERVDFKFAPILGQSGVTVGAQSTVEIKTKLQLTLPLYAFTGCDYGLQTIAQPTNGQSSDGVNLSASSDSNTKIGYTALATDPSSSLSPPAVALNSSSSKIVITGSALDTVTKIGFFRSATTNPPAPVEILANSSGWNLSGTTSLTVTIPSSVTSVEDTWFVRLYGPSNGQTSEWTPVQKSGNADKSTNLAAFPFVVGTATLSCAQGSTSGNFGSLLLPNGSPGAPSGQDENIAYNIAYGLQYGLAPYPQDKWTSNYECVDGQDGVGKTWPKEGTNCVGTKPGLPATAAQAGLVTGVAPDNKALLKTTANQCSHDWPGAADHMTTAPTGDVINNDVLTCFFTDGTTTVSQVSSSSYSFATPKIEQSIYKSPRFVLVPVLGKGPSSGSSANYEIVDFRPGFITDQGGGAVRGAKPDGGNGLVWTANNKLQAVKIIFLNPSSLPDPPLDANGKYIPYVGSGTKHLLLVD